MDLVIGQPSYGVSTMIEYELETLFISLWLLHLIEWNHYNHCTQSSSTEPMWSFNLNVHCIQTSHLESNYIWAFPFFSKQSNNCLTVYIVAALLLFFIIFIIVELSIRLETIHERNITQQVVGKITFVKHCKVCYSVNLLGQTKGSPKWSIMVCSTPTLFKSMFDMTKWLNAMESISDQKVQWLDNGNLSVDCHLMVANALLTVADSHNGVHTLGDDD